MPDITMCSGQGCPMKEHCYRFKATPSEYRQSWFMEPPVKMGKCEFFWEDEYALYAKKQAVAAKRKSKVVNKVNKR